MVMDALLGRKAQLLPHQTASGRIQGNLSFLALSQQAVNLAHQVLKSAT